MATANEWRGFVSEWKSSGLTAAEFGSRHGLTEKHLHNWAYRLGMTAGKLSRRRALTSAVGLLRVIPRSGGEGRTSPAVASTGIRLSLAGGATVDLHADFDAATLRKVLAVSKSLQEAGR